MGHPKVFAIWVVEIAPQAPVFPHEGEAPDDVADWQAGVMGVVVVVVVELVIEGLQRGEGGVGAPLDGLGVSGSVAQGRHGRVKSGVPVLGLQSHGRVPQGRPGEGSGEVPRVEHVPAVLQLHMAVHRHLSHISIHNDSGSGSVRLLPPLLPKLVLSCDGFFSSFSSAYL